MIHPYRESLLSQLYPGYQHSSNCLVPAVLTFEKLLPLAERYRAKVTWRLDGGFGGDPNVDWLLARRYGLVAKGCSNRRSANLVDQVKRWQMVRPDKFIGRVPTPEKFCRPLGTFSIRYQTAKGWKHTYLFSTLNRSGLATARFYDQRGGAETEFRSDKSGGLYLHKRRKHKRDPQEVWILLTDIAHNYLAWFARTILADSPFAAYGFLRITRDLFRIPGMIEMEHGQLLSVKLLKSSPYAEDLLACLQRFWD
jgi:hypothetical protein